MAKACAICGNKKAKEIEPQVMYSDGDGDDLEEIEYICKEDKGCNA
jgi:hypothetical protein